MGEELIRVWIGKKQDAMYQKMGQSDFNIWAFLFNWAYFAYRKMYLWAIGIFAIMSALGYIFNTLLKLQLVFGVIYIICGLITGALFYKIYYWHIDKKLKKYEENGSEYDEAFNIAKKKGGTSILAPLLPVIVLVIILLGSIMLILFDSIGNFENAPKNSQNENDYNIYNGDEFTLKHSNGWKLNTIYTGEDMLTNEAYGANLGINGKTTLWRSFNTERERKVIYDDLYEIFRETGYDMRFYDGSDGFNILKDNIYYATIDYGFYGDYGYQLNGKIFVIVSQKYDIVLSFMSYSEPENYNKVSEEIFKILKTIEFTRSRGKSEKISNSKYSNRRSRRFFIC